MDEIDAILATVTGTGRPVGMSRAAWLRFRASWWAEGRRRLVATGIADKGWSRG